MPEQPGHWVVHVGAAGVGGHPLQLASWLTPAPLDKETPLSLPRGFPTHQREASPGPEDINPARRTVAAAFDLPHRPAGVERAGSKIPLQGNCTNSLNNFPFSWCWLWEEGGWGLV